MALNMRFLPVLLLILFLFASEITPRVTAARQCTSPSKKFRGVCLYDTNCKVTCKTEGFPSGSCDGFVNRKCVCYKPCPVV
ncbi:hypothetical protein ACHQM5_005256 [Ranunculus cassubicifolius]